MTRSRGLFVVFEGIDGSGKTTISSAVAKALRAEGLSVDHVREGGRFASKTTSQIRDFTRDARNLALEPVTELLLYAAREAQLLGEATIPALAKNDVVIADRFVYTPEVLAREGRGLGGEVIAPVVRAAAQGVEPDLVVLVDVDPHVARARRKVSKVLSGETKPSSRKGLAGAGLQHRLVVGYRALAAADTRRWLVVDNRDAALDEVVARVTAAIGAARRDGAAGAIAAARKAAPAAPRTRPATTPAEALEALLDWVDARSAREPALAAWFLGGLAGPGVDERRWKLAELAPAIVAGGLRGLDDGESWRLRDRLAGCAPAAVARSLLSLMGARADAMRETLSRNAADAVARSLIGRDDAAAWAFRDRLFATASDAVAISVAGLSNSRAEELRELWLARRGGEAAFSDPSIGAMACAAVTGDAGEQAWRWRDLSLAASPPEALASLRGVTDERSFALRAAFLSRAPKPVLESLFGIDDPRAWDSRESVGERCKEALDSIMGLDGERSWKLRERLRDAWPSTAVKSVLPMSGSPRAEAFVNATLERHPGHLALWKQAALVALKETPCAAASA